MSKQALLIFTKNPEAGKVKTRLAATLDDEEALSVYKKLLLHTVLRQNICLLTNLYSVQITSSRKICGIAGFTTKKYNKEMVWEKE